MTYPECPDSRTDCRFSQIGGFSTSAYSPIERDRAGNAVAGGKNTCISTVRCSVCSQSWTETRTDLQIVQGVKPNWLIEPGEGELI